MKKSYIVIGEADVHEYDLHVEDTDKGTEYSLHASTSPIWTESTRGKLMLRMIDDGNLVIFERLPEARETLKLDYHVLTYLRILINFEQAICKTASKFPYKIYETALIAEA